MNPKVSMVYTRLKVKTKTTYYRLYIKAVETELRVYELQEGTRAESQDFIDFAEVTHEITMAVFEGFARESK